MKMLFAILMGLISASVVTGITGKLFGSIDGRMLVPSLVKAAIVLVTVPVGAWLVLRKAKSWRRLVHNGCALGATEYAASIASAWIYQHRISSALSSSELTQPEHMERGTNALVSSGLNGMIALFCLGVCVVGLMFTRVRPASETTSPQTGGGAHPGPSPVITRRLMAAEVVLATLLLAVFVWCRSSDLGLGALPVAIVLVMGIGLLVILAIAGLTQGLILLVVRRHRSLAIATTVVSAIPILFAGYLVAATGAGLRKLDASIAERRDLYRQMEPFFRTPQELESAYVVADGIVLSFAHGPEARMFALDGEALARFCNEFLVGRGLDVRVPEEERFLWEPYVNVLYEGVNLERYQEDMTRADAHGQWNLNRAAMLAARRSSVPSPPDSNEVARIARGFRAFADSDASGLLDEREGRSFAKTIEFGLEASLLANRGLGRARIAASTGVAPEILDERAREYGQLAKRMEVAGLVDLPTLTLPLDKDR